MVGLDRIRLSWIGLFLRMFILRRCKKDNDTLFYILDLSSLSQPGE